MVAAMWMAVRCARADIGAPQAGATGGTFVHPGLLHTEADFVRMRMKVAARAQPWASGWDRLLANPHSSLTWKPRPAEVVFRGIARGHAQNYPVLYNDIAAAYACALRWRIRAIRLMPTKPSRS